MRSEGRISTETRGPLLFIGVDRPEKLNAFDPPMLAALSEAYGLLEREPDLRVGVLFAKGGDFTAGLDLGKVAPLIVQGGGLFPEGGVDPFGVHGPAREKPVVAAVQGRCLTLGIELCLASDIVVAAEDTRFAQIEIKRGIFPFGGATLRWIHVSGWGNAMRWLLTGDELDAAEAHRIGLVQEVVPVGQQLARATTLAETIAKQAPLGVQATLRSARAAFHEGFRAAAQALMPELLKLMASDDAREGLASFLERREARFTGK
jgi:enoyl-CoA hydratase/carnithine racemase